MHKILFKKLAMENADHENMMMMMMMMMMMIERIIELQLRVLAEHVLL